MPIVRRSAPTRPGARRAHRSHPDRQELPHLDRRSDRDHPRRRPPRPLHLQPQPDRPARRRGRADADRRRLADAEPSVAPPSDTPEPTPSPTPALPAQSLSGRRSTRIARSPIRPRRSRHRRRSPTRSRPRAVRRDLIGNEIAKIDEDGDDDRAPAPEPSASIRRRPSFGYVVGTAADFMAVGARRVRLARVRRRNARRRGHFRLRRAS